MRFMLAAFMTGSLMLKRRFLQKKHWLSEFHFSKAAISLKHFELLKISIGYFFLNELPPQKTNLSTVLVSGEMPGTKCRCWTLFVTR